MILLAGGNAALLEGLAQALSHTGHRVAVADAVEEADDILARHLPLVVVVERAMAASATDGFVRRAASTGSAIVTYREAEDAPKALPPSLARHVLADLVLPLERNRLVALAEHLATRARVVGRTPDVTPQEPPAS